MQGPPPVRPGGGRASWLAGAGVLVLVCWLTYFVGLGQSSLWRAQEGRIGVVARHMGTSGDWILPEAEKGKVCTGKPVLYHWVVALLGAARGFDEVTVRAPSAVASVLIVLLVYGWASGFQSRGGALVSALVLATGLKFIVMARMARVDMLLTLWVTVSYLCFYLGYRRRGRRRRRAGADAYLLLVPDRPRSLQHFPGEAVRLPASVASGVGPAGGGLLGVGLSRQGGCGQAVGRGGGGAASVSPRGGCRFYAVDGRARPLE